MIGSQKHWDVFISHASEDKDSFARPLAETLRRLGVLVWYDEFSLRVGDSLSESIGRGLASSRFAIVVISPHFLGKHWTKYELRGLTLRDVKEGRVVLPVWHGVTEEQVSAFNPALADKVAINTADLSAQDIAIKLLFEVRPDLYVKHPRAKLADIASGIALKDLQHEIDTAQKALEEAQEELAEYRCPYCGAPLSTRLEAPADPDEKQLDTREEFACGYRTFGGYVERPCPSDPKFPKFEEYELQYYHDPKEFHWSWQCYAVGKTEMARRLSLSPGSGRTREEAETGVHECYDRYLRKFGD